MSFFHPFKSMAYGFTAYLRGARWLRQHPRYLMVLFLPMLFAVTSFVLTWNFFLRYDDEVMKAILFAKPVEWWWLPFYYVCEFLIYAAFFVMSFMLALLLCNIFAAPFYEIVSSAVERDLVPGKHESLSFWASFRLMGEEVKKSAFILTLSLLLLLIPGINVVSALISAALIGWDYYDYPMARRGWSFNRRLRCVLQDGWVLMGFGIWLIIPFAQVILAPLAVAGGTILNLERLRKQG